MRFESHKEYYEFFNPFSNRNEKVEIEIRVDPLTGRRSRVLQRPLPFSKNPELPDFRDEWCPFCDENIHRVGARDLRVLKGKILKRGRSILLANISPYGATSLVIRLTNRHYLALDEFEAEDFYNAFTLARDYLSKTDYEFATISMNYLKPAGSTVTHPHIQVVSSPLLFDYQERILECAKLYFKEKGKSFWSDFWTHAEDLRIGERLWRWFCPFAPRGFYHVSAFIERGLSEMDDELMMLAEGIVSVLKAYSKAGFNSFNFGFFAPMERKEYIPALFDMVARSVFDKYYWNDIVGITKIYDEAYTDKKPEEVAKEIKKYFNLQS